ncbi:hypothetical protein OROGR_019307 [Orobanche gracilis]
MDRYGGLGVGDMFEQLASLRQEGDVEEYIEMFEKLTAQVKKLPDDQFFGYFIHGLKDNLKGRIRSMRALGPLSRSRLMTLVRTVEMELQGGRSGGGLVGKKDSRIEFGPQLVAKPNFNAGYKSNLGSDWVHVRGQREAPGAGNSSRAGAVGPSHSPRPNRNSEYDRKGTWPRDRGTRHLTTAEISDRRQKGLCFKCGGKFHPMHQCPDKQLRIMVLEDHEEAIDDEPSEEGDAEVEIDE